MRTELHKMSLYPLSTEDHTWELRLYKAVEVLCFGLGVLTDLVLPDEVLHHRKDSIDISLLSRSKFRVVAWYVAFHSLGEWIGYFCDILRGKIFK